MSEKLFGALEAGGTKMVCAIIDENGKILQEETIPTTTPKETSKKMLKFFQRYKICVLGIGTFGPVDLNPKSPTYACILNTPKPGWKNYSFLDAFKPLNVPIAIETDVNASCIGETTYGKSRGLKNVIYITIGTGIGAGIYVEGNLLHGMLHPEGGHVILTKLSNDKGECICPYHKSCFEGLVSGPSIEKRFGKPGKELKDDKEALELISEYISQALVDYIMLLVPERIILGGGVMHMEKLFPLIRKNVLEKINNYLETKQLKNIDEYIVPASLNDKQGILGCCKIAIDKYNSLKK